MSLSLPSSIQALVFDAYGTLFDVQTLTGFLQQHYGEKAGRINDIWRQKQLQYTWLRALMERYEPFARVTTDALRFACRSLGEDLSEDLASELAQKYDTLEAFPDAKTALARLSGRLQLGVLSNANPSMLHQAIDHNGLKPYLNHILSVDPIQQYKPKPEVYDLAVQAFGLEKQEIAFVSTNTWDVAGAKSAGLNVIWLNRHQGRQEELGIQADWIISSLDDFRSM